MKLAKARNLVGSEMVPVQVGISRSVKASVGDPSRHAPVFVGYDLVDTGCTGGVGCRLLEVFAQLGSAEEDPVVVVSTIETVF